ncbi:olfactory receptor 6X1-like [Eublepharis macularius]|uniref:Olfactory receptor n=1 Tax=Eublepharis macularius TaxID=481883 RepID=A0AA97K7L8_EUBMA|nr:olfactory receptor 6X1-like [Eublepharis macularius]
MANKTSVSNFILLGFPSLRRWHLLLFTLVLVIYILTMAGNSLIIIIVRLSQQLQTPMYFFLSNLSFLEIWFTTAVVPKMLETFLRTRTTICLHCCLVQSFFHFFLGMTEFFILTAMSFDRYVAICKPLHYTTIMTRKLCSLLALGSWSLGFVVIVMQAAFLWKLPFCAGNIIDHYFCDIGPILKLACADTSLVELLGLLATITIIPSCFIFTVVSYVFIISTILRIPSSKGRQKAFSTCASHLTVVTIPYGAVLFMYLKPTAHSSFSFNKVVSVLNTVWTPLLNPFIYTIRNKDVKAAVKAVVKKAIAK